MDVRSGDENCSCIDFHDVANSYRAVEVDAARVPGPDVFSAQEDGAGSGRFVDPTHNGAAVSVACPVGGVVSGHEAERAAWSSSLAGVAFGQHGVFDACAHGDTFQSQFLARGIVDAAGLPGPDGVRFAVFVDGHKHQDAVHGTVEFSVMQASGVHGDKDVDAGGSGVDHFGADFHDGARADGSVIVDVADVCSDAITGAPRGGAGVACTVDPFEDSSGLDVFSRVVHVLG